MKMSVPLAALLCLALAAVPATASDDATVYKVVSARTAQTPQFQQQDGTFTRAGAVDGTRLVGARVVEVSNRGYVLVDTADGPVWVDKLSVKIEPKLPLNARCLAGVSVMADATNAIVRGATEGCQ